ncbi:MAG: hypothetical protein WDN06_19655 [Asticcacaulis sp.]
MNAITPHLPQNAVSPPPPRNLESVVLDLGLKAQGRLLPYALGFFGIGLPLFLWTARLSLSPWLMAFYMLLFIIDWTVFMVPARPGRETGGGRSERYPYPGPPVAPERRRRPVGPDPVRHFHHRVGGRQPRRNLPDDLRRRRRRHHHVHHPGPAQPAGPRPHRRGRPDHRLP